MKKKMQKFQFHSLNNNLSSDEEEFMKLQTRLDVLDDVDFSENFTDSVMNRISQMQSADLFEETVLTKLTLVFRPLALAAVLILAVLLPLNLYKGYSLENSNTDEIITLVTDQMLLEELP